MIDELGNEVTDDRVQALVEHIRFKSDTMSWETGLILKALMVEGASTRDALAAAEAKNAELTAALLQIIGVLGPTPCRCEGQQEEVVQALKIARAVLSRQPAGGVVGE